MMTSKMMTILSMKTTMTNRNHPGTFLGNLLFLLVSPVVLPLFLITVLVKTKGKGFSSQSAWCNLLDQL